MINRGFRQCVIMHYFAHISCGISHVGFTGTDFYNRVSMSCNTETPITHLEAIISYLNAKKIEDCDMALVTHVENSLVTRCYWADSRCQLDYHYFSDVVAFDSTFKTNACDIVMIVIVGVNHHHQTIVFGYALINKESIEA